MGGKCRQLKEHFRTDDLGLKWISPALNLQLYCKLLILCFLVILMFFFISCLFCVRLIIMYKSIREVFVRVCVDSLHVLVLGSPAGGAVARCSLLWSRRERSLFFSFSGMNNIPSAGERAHQEANENERDSSQCDR